MIQMFTKKRRKGFTLIELIVVIAILGILAAIAIPRLTGFSDDARLKAHNANIATIESAANIFVIENGNPKTAITDSATALSPKYLKVMPTNPWADTDHADKSKTYSVSITTDGLITVNFK